jgi:hypothetical protein
MTVSTADVRAARGACGAAAMRRALAPLGVAAIVLVAGAGSAYAQSGAPLRLAPPERFAPPPSELPATAPSAAGAGAGIPADGVVVQRLGGIDSEAVGVLLPDHGGLAEPVWQDSSRALVVGLLTRLSGTIASPPLRDLVRRLLLTTARPPAAAGADDGSLLAARTRLLVAMGAVADADALIAAAGRRASGGDLAWPSFEARLLANDAAGACRIVRERGRDLAGADWQKALIFCQLIAEQTDQAQFGLNLLRERRIGGDPLFFTVADALAASQTPKLDVVTGAASATPLDLAMLRLAWTAVPARLLDGAPAGIHAAVARTPDLAEDERLATAIRAEAAGAMDAAELRALFGDLKITRQELAAALTIADSEAPSRAVALLYLSARSQDVPAARAEVLQRLWEVASAHGIAGTAARVAAPLLVEMPVLPEFAWFAGTAARMALYASDLPRALGWYEIAAAAASTDSVARDTATALWPLMRLALGDVRRLPQTRPAPAPAEATPPVTVVGGAVPTVRPDAVAIAGTMPAPGGIAVPWDGARLVQWLRAEAERAGADAPARALKMLALLDAAGDLVPDAAWRDALPPAGTGAVAAPAAATDSAYRLGLDRAAAGGRTGEAILFAAAALAGRDAGAVDASTLWSIVGALARVGQAEPARAVAVDAALSAGL